MKRLRPHLYALLLLPALVAFTLSSQPAGQEAAPATADLVVEAVGSAGGLPAELTAADFEVFAGGRKQEVQAVEGGAEASWRILIYLDRSLTSPQNLRRATSTLGEMAPELTRLGPVEIVRADPQPSRLLAASQDPAIVEASLGQAVLQGEVSDELRALRESYLQEGRRLSLAASAGVPSEDLETFLDGALETETRLLRRQADYLLSWLAEASLEGGSLLRPGRQLLIWVQDGYEDSPQDFYLAELPNLPTAAALRQQGIASPTAGLTQELARSLAALGWVSVGVSLEAPSTAGKDSSAYDTFQQSSSPDPTRSQPTWTSTTLEELRRKLKGESPELAARPLLEEPLAPLEEIADATGGAVVTASDALRDVVSGLAGRRLLRFEAPAEGGLTELAVRARRPGLRLASRRWLASSLPDAVAAARVRRVLAADSPEGQLDVLATLKSGGSQEEAAVEVRADLLPLAEPAGDDAPPRQAATVRVTLGFGSAAGPSLLLHEVVAVDSLIEAGDWLFRKSLHPPASYERLAVLVEDLETGVWGGHLAAAVDSRLAEGDAEPSETEISDDDETFSALTEAAFLPKARAIRILPPAEASRVLQGKVRFRTLVNRQDIERVVFYLDDRQVEEVTRAPFAAQIQLGRFPRPHTVRAVAFAGGREVGRDALVINDAGQGFRVSILSPQGGEVRGSVEVDVDVRIPPNQRLDRLEISWNEQPVATLYGPPFRQRMTIPAANPQGFIRAVGYLSDGRTSEDVVFLNERDFADRLQIRLVELFTVVTDRDGRPVRGLSRGDFVVREEGQVQEVESFDDAGDFPLSMGLVIDSSASMFVKLPTVQRAARDFVQGFLTGRDQALLVDFDTAPRLARELTSNLRQVTESIGRLEADGDTHLWESVVFTLMELQGVSGKKAVVIFSDGAEEEEGLPYKTCYDLTRRLGIPVYLIVLHPGLARGDDLGPGMKSFTRKLDRLTAAAGGRTYYIPNTKDLASIYREIDVELRSQYLLTYYPSEPVVEGEVWRNVSVEVKPRGMTARTVSGYFVR